MWLRSGGERSDPVLAVEARGGEGEGGGRGGTSDITSNNPHLTGGEKIQQGSNKEFPKVRS